MHRTQGSWVNFDAKHLMQPTQVPKSGQCRPLKNFLKFTRATQALTSWKAVTVAASGPASYIALIALNVALPALCMLPALCYIFRKNLVLCGLRLAGNRPLCQMKSMVWLPCTGRTPRHLLWVRKLSPSKYAVIYIHEQLRDTVHISVVIVCVTEWRPVRVKSKWTLHWHIRTSSTTFERSRWCEQGMVSVNLALLDFSITLSMTDVHHRRHLYSVSVC